MNLAWHLYKQDTRKFFDQWDSWVQDLPQDVLDVALLRKVVMKYFLRADVSSDDVPDYKYIIDACVIYAAAAQRAHNRADSFAAWNLLTEANLLLSKVDSKQKDLHIQEQEAAKSDRLLAIGDVPGQRVRYQIIVLLDREHQKKPVKFKSVESAINLVDDDIAHFIDNNNLQIAHHNLATKFKAWIRDHPAFRAEIAPFFADGVIKT